MVARAFQRSIAAIVAAVSALLVLGGARCVAADASSWHTGTHSAARLIAASAVREQSGTVLRAGVEIALQPGWKTYWRYPGDSGMPPRFDFARSENVTDVMVKWPAPHRFSDGAGHSIGYTGSVIFPLRVTAADERKPVMLRLDLDYGVCEKLCVPVDAKLELPLTRKPSAHEALLAASEARVPKAVAVGPREPVAVLAVRRETGPHNPQVVVDVLASSGSHVDLFAEGPTAEWALPLPQLVDSVPGGVRRFVFDLDGLPPGAKPEGAAVKLTAVSDVAAIEVSAHLD